MRRARPRVNAALNVLEAQAQFDGPERTVSVRVAEHDGLIYLDLADEFWRCRRNRPARMADRRRPSGPLPPAGRHAAASAAGAGRVDRGTCAVLESSQPRRLRARRRLAVGGAASRRSLSAPGDIGRAGLGEDRPLENVAGAGRSQRRPGAGAAAGGARTVHRRQQRPRPGLRQSHRLAALAVGYALPARRAAAPSRSASSTPIRTRCCLRPPGRSFSTASRMSSPGPISPTAPSC